MTKLANLDNAVHPANDFAPERPLSPADVAAVRRTEAALADGSYFLRGVEFSTRYEPPIRARDYGHAVEALGKFARTGDQEAAIVRTILPKLNLYGTPSQFHAALYRGAYEAVSKDFDDVIGRTGPEAGRWRDHQKPYTMGVKIALAFALEEAFAPMASWVPGVGWVLPLLLRAYGWPIHAHVFTRWGDDGREWRKRS